MPVGIGPFRYAAWKRGDSVVNGCERCVFPGHSEITRIVFEIVPDRNVVSGLMRSHELDLWSRVPGHYFQELEKLPGTRVLSYPSYFFDHLDFNLTNPALRDRTVRRALRYAIDRRTIDDKINHGLQILTESPVSTASRFYRALPPVPFDLEKANALLDGAAWKRRADGVRAKGGLRLSFHARHGERGTR